jgi:ribosomal protein S27AE
MQLRDFECPNCGGYEMLAGEDQQLHCAYCGSSFGEVTRICPQCGHYNEREVRHCSECGARLVRDCPACGAANWALSDHCVQCGRNLDLIDQMARRWQLSTEERLAERQASVASLKEDEERASQGRMAALLEAERIRQEALALARETQRKRDQQMYRVTAIAIGVFLLIIVVMLLLMIGRG